MRFSVALSPDGRALVSASHDGSLKSWYLTPRLPDPPEPPRIVAISDSTVSLQWTAPAAFNEDVTAFFLQWRMGIRQPWTPEPPLSIPPEYRSKVLRGLFYSTSYQFRLKAENRMGCSEWSEPSLLVRIPLIMYTHDFLLEARTLGILPCW